MSTSADVSCLIGDVLDEDKLHIDFIKTTFARIISNKGAVSIEDRVKIVDWLNAFVDFVGRWNSLVGYTGAWLEYGHCAVGGCDGDEVEWAKSAFRKLWVIRDSFLKFVDDLSSLKKRVPGITGSDVLDLIVRAEPRPYPLISYSKKK